LRRFPYEAIAHSKPIKGFVITMVGADRVMIASDYCFDRDYSEPLGFLEELNLSSERRKIILGTTAAKLLKLNVPTGT
jgi:aminocarboxymuconate-semialdehyde decarboxylase